MGLEDFSNGSSSTQKQTHLSFGNPEHEDVSQTYADDESQQRHFDAATGLQNSPYNRKMLAGEVLSAVYKGYMGQGTEDIDEMINVLEELKEDLE